MRAAVRQDGPATATTGTLLEEVAPGVHRLRTGRRLTEANVYLVESGPSWVLVDAAWPHRAGVILAAAQSLFGPATRPAAILLTHAHPDHSGSALALARALDAPVHVHPAELPNVSGELPTEALNPLDRVIVPVLRRLPRRRAAPRDRLADVVRTFDPSGPVPGLPDWRCVPTPGHSPGQVAFFRPADRVLISGDAVLTVDLNSVRNLLLRRHRLCGPPWIATSDWAQARESVAQLADLEPTVIAPGHGRPMTGAVTAPALHALVPRLDPPLTFVRILLRGVDYSSPGRYRPPPAAYLRLQWLAHLLTALGRSPGNVVNLEVPGRRSGIIRRTTLVRTEHEGQFYLVALAGESEWVRNVRAAGGSVVLGRRERRVATLVEVPPDERPPVLRAYLLPVERRGSTPAADRMARSYFGVSANASEEDLRVIAPRHPVFRIVSAGSPAGTSAASRPGQ